MTDRKIILIVDNVRSANNVGSIWRTAEAAGVSKMLLCGITPHPAVPGDTRPPYVVDRTSLAIAKTALGAQDQLPFEYYSSTAEAVASAKQGGCKIVALEQTPDSTNLMEFQPQFPLAIIIGHERAGVDASLPIDAAIEIPMLGRKESLNVAVATGIALYHLRFGV